ncbi:MAG: hypothetical protein EOO61_22035 [Hymenobacter sp.]|nr:MAG: hypothetical protein EOO61_22035 [Hymenobacter sp.]
MAESCQRNALKRIIDSRLAHLWPVIKVLPANNLFAMPVLGRVEPLLVAQMGNRTLFVTFNSWFPVGPELMLRVVVSLRLATWCLAAKASFARNTPNWLVLCGVELACCLFI